MSDDIANAHFWARVAVGTDDACWPWIGRLDPRSGMPRYRPLGRHTSEGSARRYIWEAHHGSPGRRQFMVTCGTQSCVNPRHICFRAELNGGLEGRLMRKISKVGECWEWTGRRTEDGYGQIRVGSTMARAHRVMYEVAKGVIPEGLELDHLCRNRACVNPGHLEPITHLENVRRASACHREVEESG